MGSTNSTPELPKEVLEFCKKHNCEISQNQLDYGLITILYDKIGKKTIRLNYSPQKKEYFIVQQVLMKTRESTILLDSSSSCTKFKFALEYYMETRKKLEDEHKSHMESIKNLEDKQKS